MKLKRKLPETCLLPKNGKRGVWLSCEALDWMCENDISWMIARDGEFTIPDEHEEILFIIRFATDRSS